MKARHWILLALVALTAARFWCLGRIELSPDEAYHCLWSQHPDWCYYDKGPAVAMTIRAGTEWFGANEFGVRFFSPLLALGTSLVLFVLARKLYGETVALWTVAALNMLPFFQSGSLMMTPGAISVFFWAAAMLTFWLALERGPAFSFYWPATGLLIGAGFLTDYAGAIELLSITLVLATTGKFRREFARPGFWTLLFFFIPCTIPAFMWNDRHEWITLVSWRGQFGADGFHPLATAGWLADCAMGCSPLIFAAVILAVVWGSKKARHQFKPRFLLLFSLPLLGLEFLLSLGKSAGLDSSVPAFVGLVLLSAALWLEAAKADKKRAVFAGLALCTGLVLSIYNTVDSFGGTGSVQETGGRLPWKTVAATVGGLRKEFEQQTGKPVFLIGSGPWVASILSFYLPEKRVEGPGHPPVYIPESQMIENQFSYWPRYDEFVAVPKGAQNPDAYYTEEQGVNPFMGRAAIFISDEDSAEPPTAVRNSFERVEAVVPKDKSLPGIRVFACYNYRSLPL